MNIKKELWPKAQTAIAKAVRNGDLVRPDTCELCGAQDKIFAHHWAGYAPENWLNVWWVCNRCNQALRNLHDGSITKEQAKDMIVTGTINTTPRNVTLYPHQRAIVEQVGHELGSSNFSLALRYIVEDWERLQNSEG